MLATYLVPLVFGFAAISTMAYWLASRGRQEWYQPARLFYHAATVGVMVMAAVLMYLIQTDQFQYTYVWEYSSREQATIFKYSSFYSGQEGSFLLWSLFTAIIGVFLMQYAAKQKYELQVMRVFTLVLAFLLFMLVAKNPFEYVWQSFASDGVAQGFVPRDGRGLNPLLQNYWIAIHPPCLVLGFSAMTVPFVFAVAGLQKRDYQGWITTAMPWTLFGAMILGLGIMLGGFWAYETLGWGGFWGWDPVENSSLIPWLVCVALVHTMLTQKRTRGLIKTNFVLALFTFLLVLYSTFLTRSGVLGDASVHSFVSPGNFVYVLLLVFIGVFLAIGLIPLIQRTKELIPLGREYRIWSRETALGLGSAVLSACAVIVLLGTSWPIIAKASVDPSFYNTLNLPIAIIIGLVNGISMLLKWKNTEPGQFWRSTALSGGIAGAATAAAVIAGLHDVKLIVLAFASFYALVVNTEVGIRIFRGNRRFIGAYVSHFGIAFLFLGIVALSYASKKTTIELAEGEQRSALGYTFTYVGKQQVELDKSDREKYEYNVEVTKGDQSFTVHPVVFWSDFNKRQQPIFNPGIKNLIVHDVYVAPQGAGQSGGTPVLDIQKGMSVRDTLSGATIKFVDFDFSSMNREKMLEGQKTMIGALLEVTGPTGHTDSVTAFAGFAGGEPEPIAKAIPGTHYTVYFVKPEPNRDHPEDSRATVAIVDDQHPAPPPKEMIALEVSIKPFINLVWSGTIIMVVGFFLAMMRRNRETQRELRAPQPPAAS